MASVRDKQIIFAAASKIKALYRAIARPKMLPVGVAQFENVLVMDKRPSGNRVCFGLATGKTPSAWHL